MDVWRPELSVYAEVLLRPPELHAEMGQIQQFRRERRELVKGSTGQKKTPYRLSFSGGGLSTRAAWNHTHAARLHVWRRLHRSAPLKQGDCHTDCPTMKP